MANPVQREEVADPLALNPLQKGPDRSLPTYGVRNPGQGAGNAASKIGMTALQALDGIQASIGRVWEQEKENRQVNGMVANARGQTEASLGDDKYGKQGFQALESSKAAANWFTQEADFIANGGGDSMDPAEYEKRLNESYTKQFDNLPEDPASRKMWVQNFKDFGPRLMSMQTEGASKYNEGRGIAALSSNIGNAGVYRDASIPTGERGYRVSQEPVRQPVQTTPEDDDTAIRTILGEAGGEGARGMAAVGSVLLNRAGSGRFPNTVGEVAKQKLQFSTWNQTSGMGGNNPDKWDPKSAAYQKAAAIWSDIKSGKVVDPTGGATHFTRADTKAYWWDEESKGKDTVIGNHLFASHTKQEGSFVDTATNAQAGSLSFANKGQEGINEVLQTALVNTSSFMGKQLKITSGYRDPAHNAAVGGAKESEHTHRNAADIDMQGMSDQERYELVQTLRAQGVKRFGAYSKQPNMLHVDLSEAQGQSWFMYDRTNQNMASAPAWLQQASKEEAPTPDSVGQARTTGSQIQRIIQNSPLKPQAKAEAVVTAMVRAFDQGDDSVFNDSGGMALLSGLGATNDQMQKVFGAQKRWEEKEDKTFDLNREKARADVLARVANNEFPDVNSALNAVDEFFKTHKGTDASAQALARQVASDWNKARTEGEAIVPTELRDQAARLKGNLDLGVISPAEAAEGIEAMGKRLGVKASVVNSFMSEMYGREQGNQDRMRGEAETAQKAAVAEQDTMARIQTAIVNGSGLKGLPGQVTIPDDNGADIKVSGEQGGIWALKKSTIDSVNKSIQRQITPEMTLEQVNDLKEKGKVEATNTVYENLAKQGVYDTKFGQEMASSVTGSLIDPETKQVRKESLEALSTYMQLRNNPAVGPAYVAGMIQDPKARTLLEMAAGLYNGQYNIEMSLTAAQDRLNQAYTPDQKLEMTGQYYKEVKTGVASAVRSMTEMDGVFSPVFSPWKSANLRLIENSPNVPGYIYQQANTYFLQNPNIPMKTAVDLAKQDLEKNAVAMGKNIIIGNEREKTRLDQVMGVESMGKTAPNDALMDYLNDFGGTPDNWGQLWADRAGGGFQIKSGRERFPNDGLGPVGNVALAGFGIKADPEIGVTYNPTSQLMEVVLFEDGSRTKTVGNPINIDPVVLGDRYKQKMKVGEASWLTKSWRDYVVDPIVNKQQERDAVRAAGELGASIGGMAKQ